MKDVIDDEDKKKTILEKVKEKLGESEDNETTKTMAEKLFARK